MGRVSNYWEIGGTVNTDRGKTETMVAKRQGSPSNKPSYSEAEIELRNAAAYYLPGDKVLNVNVTNISWVYS